LFIAWYRHVDPLVSFHQFHLRYLNWSLGGFDQMIITLGGDGSPPAYGACFLSLFAGGDIIYLFNFTRAVFSAVT
jgi:hypothetical protein